MRSAATDGRCSSRASIGRSASDEARTALPASAKTSGTGWESGGLRANCQSKVWVGTEEASRRALGDIRFPRARAGRDEALFLELPGDSKIGRASCRERV